MTNLVDRSRVDKNMVKTQDEIAHSKGSTSLDPSIRPYRIESPHVTNHSPERPSTTASIATMSNPTSSNQDFYIPQSKQYSAQQKPQHGQHKSAKTRLNLLNPMSLLLRRRSSQAVAYLTDGNNSIPPVPRMPDDYDPRIRGVGVHDFNAPRPKRNVSSNDLRALSTASENEGNFQKYTNKEYTPAFKEQFGEAGMVKISKDDNLKGRNSSQNHNPNALPPFARRLPHVPDDLRRVRSEMTLNSESSIDQHRIEEHGQLQQLPQPKSPKPRSRGPSLSDESFQPAGLPRHMASNASRFSFDLAGLGSSAQEKLLEEKHREKAHARRSTQSADVPDDDSAAEEDMYDMDDFDDDGGLEERIPGVNADEEDQDQMADPVSQIDIADFDFQLRPSSLASPENSTDASVAFMNTPRDLAGNVIGFAATKESPDAQQPHKTSQYQTPLTPDSLSGSHQLMAGLGLAGISDFSTPGPNRSSISPPLSGNELDAPQVMIKSSNDLMFDDGTIDLGPPTEASNFDESWFDDGADALQANPSIMSARVYGESSQQNVEIPNREFSPVKFGKNPDGLAEYHNALAHAANVAAAGGKFNRRDSVYEENRHSMGRILSEAGSSPPDNDESTSLTNLEDNDYDQDDDLEDDPIIAAANAEALANDEDGFYGQEFGFYAQSNTVRDADYANGGYFYSSEGLLRSQSGKVVSREPNLTPITERSESSNRNSTTSLQSHMQSHSFQNASPALFQLQSLTGDFGDEEMSLGALMRLRRGAFGGSNSSLRSAGSGASLSGGSPLSHHPARQSSSNLLSLGPLETSNANAGASNGTPSSNSPISELDSAPASPTIVLSIQGRSDSAAEKNKINNSSETAAIKPVETWKKGHSRTGSGADSVSYSREENEDGGERWILEKRRMSSSGEMELVGREIVGSGRI